MYTEQLTHFLIAADKTNIIIVSSSSGSRT